MPPSGAMAEPRRFPPPWSVDDPDMKLGQDCYIVRDGNGQALAYVYFEDKARTDLYKSSGEIKCLGE
jgi:hypothetical protein